MIVTVTLNAAIDRTLLVPNFQIGQRHRASVGYASAGGKGINVARALKRLGTPVVCTGLAGGRSGTLLVEDLTSEGILNDFVRIRGESRTSTAVLDPTSNAYTEINEWGPEVGEDELDMLRDKLNYLTQAAEFVVFAGSLPRDVQPDAYADLIRETNRRHLPTVLDTEGEALRLGIQAEPYLVAPNMREAESLVGREFVDDADLVSGLDEIAALGARNVIITLATGCYALLRGEDRTEIRVRATAPSVEPISAVGAGDTLLAGFIAARVAGKPFEDAVRTAVGAGAASVLEAGAGRVDPREASRLAGLVAVEKLEPVAQEN
jgi:1-phosphofructokinase family hexose kinase